MRSYNFSILIERDGDGYFGFCPELQGCYTQGETYEEAMGNIEDAIRLHIQDRVAEKEEVPRSRSVTLSTLEIAV